MASSKQNITDLTVVGSKGGLFIGWKGNSLVQLKNYSSYHIDVEVHDNDSGEVWRFTGFYGNPDERKRHQSWELLQQLGHDQRLP
ncbi:hypothetical protein J1N35_010563 [Gossypium stocksii]|uniref:Uncharacterized protein n=1 Tax=Gossypium stocksii TaxID=47602 RepID=A0A9D3W2Q4_9ROSI|nr:hypothetical protein J1N35_010563 [Gossypium stocksii]